MCLFYLWYSYTKPNLIITIHEDLFLLNITRPSAAQYWLQSLEGYHGYVLAIDIMKYALANQTLFVSMIDEIHMYPRAVKPLISLTLSQCTLAGPVYTEMPLADPVYTGIPLGNPANTCRVHWNTTGKT